MHADLEHLVALDRLDRELERVAREGEKSRAANQAAVEAVEAAKRHADALQQQLSDSRDEQHAAERKAKRYQDRKRSAENVLQSGVGDFKAAERQVAECTRILDECETIALEQMELQDDIARRMREADTEIAAAEEKLGELQAAGPEEAAARAEQKAGFEAERKTHWDELHEELQDRYERLCARKKRAVAPLEGDSCGACMNLVQAQQRIELRKGRMIECRNCHRWLYPKD